jgi:SAM-dependent methyltransferase
MKQLVAKVARNVLPHGLRRVLRSLWGAPRSPQSRADAARARLSFLPPAEPFPPEVADLVPPPELDFVGGAEFVRIGQHFFRLFVEHGRLRPTDRVLDVGCGIGRMALPLLRYLTPPGHYDGFDVVPLGIDWCRDRITPRFPHFRFTLADVRNDMYNPAGGGRASAYRFPYPDRSNDFVFLTSVFTHLLPDDMENYLQESARVLDTGGRLFATFFLINPESDRLIRAGKGFRPLVHDNGRCRYESEQNPEFAVGYEESLIRARLRELGLRLHEPIGYGKWCGRKKFLSTQDVVIATKVRHVS